MIPNLYCLVASPSMGKDRGDNLKNKSGAGVPKAVDLALNFNLTSPAMHQYQSVLVYFPFPWSIPLAWRGGSCGMDNHESSIHTAQVYALERTLKHCTTRWENTGNNSLLVISLSSICIKLDVRGCF